MKWALFLGGGKRGQKRVLDMGKDAESSHASRGEVMEDRGLHRTGDADEDTGLQELLLALTADLGQNNLTTVTFDLFVGKHVLFDDVFLDGLHGDPLLAQPGDGAVNFSLGALHFQGE